MSYDKMNEMQLSQSHDKVLPALIQVQTTANSATRARPVEMWESHKQEIKDIYLTMNVSLVELRAIFKRKYNFTAR